MPLFGNKFSPKKSGPRKYPSMSNLNLDATEKDMEAGPIRVRLGSQEMTFDDGQWIPDSGAGMSANSKEMARVKKQYQQMVDENNLLKYKVEILLDMKGVYKKCGVTSAKRSRFSKESEANRRSLQRVVSRVKELCEKPNMPPMALVYIDKHGLIKVEGSPKITTAFSEEMKTSILQASFTLPHKTTVSAEKLTFDCCGIDVHKDHDLLKVAELRRSISKIGTCSTHKRNSTWGFNAHKPNWWPKDVPFVSPSAYKNDESGTKPSRLLNKTDLMRILTAFKGAAIEASSKGFSLINVPVDPISVEHLPRTENVEHVSVEQVPRTENVHAVSIEQLPPTEHIVNEVPTNFVKVEEERMEEDDVGFEKVQEDVQVIYKSISDQFREAIEMNDAATCVDILGSGTYELTLEDVALIELKFQTRFEPSCLPCSNKKIKKPQSLAKYLLCGDGGSLFDAVSEHTPPDVTRLCLYTHAMKHAKHYISQFSKLIDESQDIVLDLDVDKLVQDIDKLSSEDIHRIVFRACDKLLDRDCKSGACAALFTAAYLDRQVFLHTSGTVHSFPPCPCSVDKDLQEPVSFFMDNIWQCFHVLPMGLFNTPRTTRGTSKVKSKRAFSYKGIEVDKFAIDSVENGKWLDDSIINMMFAYYTDVECCGMDDVRVFSSQFALALLCKQAKSTLDFSTYNLERVQNWTRNKETGNMESFSQYRLLIFPVCDNSHWVFFAYMPILQQLVIINSGRGRYEQIAKGLCRYIEEYQSLYEGKSIKVQMKKEQVPKQTNGNDCGVHCIFLYRALLQAEDVSDINWNSLFTKDWIEKNGRNEILSVIDNFR